MLQPGARAPDFTLPAAHDDGTVSLADYLGRRALLLSLFRGLYCPFCRRQMAQLEMVAEGLRSRGVETLGIVATAPDRARAFVLRIATRLRFGADPELRTHRAYGLGRIIRTPEATEMVEKVARQLVLQLNIAAEPGHAREALDQSDGFRVEAADLADRERHQIQLTGQFLIASDGIIRWCSGEESAGYAAFPSKSELLSAIGRL